MRRLRFPVGRCSFQIAFVVVLLAGLVVAGCAPPKPAEMTPVTLMLDLFDLILEDLAFPLLPDLVEMSVALWSVTGV